MKKLVSIIIPIYNGEKYIDKCLESIVYQTYKDLEIILINDGSTDSSLKLLREYEKKDNRILVIDKKNEGQAKARNIGVDKATGDYIMFVDCDDYLELNAISKMIEIAILDNSDIIICDLKYKYSDTDFNIIKGYIDITDNCNKNFLLSDPGPCAKLFKRNLLKKSNFKFLEGHIYEDLATIPSLALHLNKISYIEKPFYNYIMHTNSTMNQIEFNPKLNDIFYSLEHLTNLLEGKFDEELEYIYIKHLLHSASLRFLKFNNKEAHDSFNKIIDIMKSKFPNWRKNKYLYLIDKKQLLLTKIIYKKQIYLYNIYRKVVGK